MYGYMSIWIMGKGYGSVKGVESDVPDSGEVCRRVEVGESRIRG